MSKQFSIRLPDEDYAWLKAQAGEQGLPISAVLKHIVASRRYCGEPSSLSMMDKTLLKALSELLYLVKAMAESLDPNLIASAQQHARQVIEQLSQCRP